MGQTSLVSSVILLKFQTFVSLTGGGKFLVETEVDLSTGETVGLVKTAVSGSQQFPEGETYTMRVSAKDENAPAGTEQSTPVELLEVKVGFREPQFHENPYRAKVIENNQNDFRYVKKTV